MRYIAELRVEGRGIISVRVEVDPRPSGEAPDGGRMGVLTAYCKLPRGSGPENTCPDWVNESMVLRPVGPAPPCTFRRMLSAEVAEIARLLRDGYSREALDPGVDGQTVVENEHGFQSVSVPRSEIPEPWRSFRLVDTAALGSTLVVTFTWDDGADDDPDDGTVYVMPLDGRDMELDMTSEMQVETFLSRLIEFTLGSPRETWEPASTPMSPRLAVVRPYWSAG